MPARLLPLRYAGSCASCGTGLSVGTSAWWDSKTKSIRCQKCASGTDSHSAAGGLYIKAIATPEAGVAGASARAEYERRGDRREERLLRDHPRLGRLMLALTEEPQSTKAWGRGALVVVTMDVVESPRMN